MKVTDKEGSVSWVVIEGAINGTSHEVYMNGFDCAIDYRTKGFINLVKHGQRVVERESITK